MAYVEAQANAVAHKSAPCPLALGTGQQTPNLLSFIDPPPPPHRQCHIFTANKKRIQYSRGQLLGKNLREDSGEMVAAEPGPAMCAPTSGESLSSEGEMRAVQGICSY